jgi:hypothetical protein
VAGFNPVCVTFQINAAKRRLREDDARQVIVVKLGANANLRAIAIAG